LREYEKKKIVKIGNFTFLLVTLTIIIENAFIIHTKEKNYIPLILLRTKNHS
jgi:hypothetical protein